MSPQTLTWIELAQLTFILVVLWYLRKPPGAA